MGVRERNASPLFADQFYMEIGQKVYPAITPIPELLQLSLSLKIILISPPVTFTFYS